MRFDTRIYLSANVNPTSSDPCVGAIIAKNPGSAQPAGGQFNCLVPITLSGDKMLPNVRNRFIAAYQHANKTIPAQAFVRIWNLFYVCGSNFSSALRTYQIMPHSPLCPSECGVAPPIIWFAWGSPANRVQYLKRRFQNKFPNAYHLFYHTRSKRMCRGSPFPANNPARHPQGTPALPMERALAALV